MYFAERTLAPDVICLANHAGVETTFEISCLIFIGGLDTGRKSTSLLDHRLFF